MAHLQVFMVLFPFRSHVQADGQDRDSFTCMQKKGVPKFSVPVAELNAWMPAISARRLKPVPDPAQDYVGVPVIVGDDAVPGGPYVPVGMEPVAPRQGDDSR